MNPKVVVAGVVGGMWVAACGGSGGGGNGGPGPTPSILLVSPNGGGRWATGVPSLVRWEATAGPALVDLDLSLDGGATWTAFESAVPNDGVHEITGPPLVTSTARLRVGAADGDPDVATEPFGESDADFEIGPLFEDSGASLLGVEAGDVDWTDVDGDGDLDLALCGYDGVGAVAKLYRNDAGALVDASAAIAGHLQSRLAWGDYDGDGDHDLVVNGFTSGVSYDTRLYENAAGVLADDGSVVGSVNGNPAWGDFDGDGDVDLALLGTEPNAATSRILENLGIGGLVDTLTPLAGYEFGALAWGDYDADGDLDLAIAGQSVPFHTTRVYRNDGGSFTDVGVSMIGWTDARLAWGDADGDGDLDLAVGCFDAGVGVNRTRIYLNDGGDVFADSGQSLGVGGGGEMAWGDVDGDGDLDLAIAGSGAGGGPLAHVYYNDSGLLTALFAVDAVPDVTSAGLAWGDFDRDGDLDLAICGTTGSERVTKVLRNLGVSDVALPTNLPPGPVPSVDVVTLPGGAVVVWEEASDLETPSSGLSYAVRVEALPSFVEVAPGLALPDGRRLVAAQGFFRPHSPLGAAAFALPPGVYLASVQAVDPSFQGGAWTPSALFVVP